MNENSVEIALKSAKASLLKDSLTWKDAFGTEHGLKALALLKKKFYDIPNIADSDPIVTQNRSAQRDLVRFIIDQVEYTGE